LKPIPRSNPWKPIWWTAVGGLRAYHVLQEILPFLLGQKLREAIRALDFFAPDGYRKAVSEDMMFGPGMNFH
jgi:hypothetical protein